MIIGILKETSSGEKQVALIPAHVPLLSKKGCEVRIETGAGLSAGFSDAEYLEKGAHLSTREEILKSSDILLQVRETVTDPETSADAVSLMRAGQILIGFLRPYEVKEIIASFAAKKLTTLSMELVPRISRAQTMDALSSNGTIAGYKAVLLAANALPKMFPMLMTAAGTITPAKVFIIGAGVAGLQAIATSRRLGAVVHAYDIRPVVKEQVESLGAKFVEMALDTGQAEDKGGYAKAMDEEFYRKQRELMSKVIAESDVVIATAFVPGKKAPVLITEQMVKGMHAGSVIVDLAASQGGNCELTELNQTVVRHGVTIIGPGNIPSEVPTHASQMYSKNLTNLLALLIKDGKINLNLQDEIIRDSMVTHEGQVTHAKVKEVLGL